jgi:hypothetical protein
MDEQIAPWLALAAISFARQITTRTRLAATTRTTRLPIKYFQPVVLTIRRYLNAHKTAAPRIAISEAAMTERSLSVRLTSLHMRKFQRF